MSELVIEKLSKHFGEVRAIDNIDLTVKDGEFLTLLGPSGCGKSTTLFAIAGLDNPTSGRISVGGRAFFDGETGLLLPPERRNCGLVFQSYALWPHMTVGENLAFPLKIRKIGKAERNRRINEALELVEMENYKERYPHELSGGQQQRVALARTIVFEPTVLLLDEPLSNLDAKLRIRARAWLRELQQRLKITTIYVTHDQTEALAMSDRIAVMNKGSIAQLATPEDVFTRPASAFVADFIGSSNFLNGHLGERDSDGGGTVNLEDGTTIEAAWTPDVEPGRKVLIAVRPEYIRLCRAEADTRPRNSVPAEISGRNYLGARYQYNLKSANTVLTAETDDCVENGAVYASFSREHAVAVLP